MKKYVLLLLTLLVSASPCVAQTVVQGSILSITGDPLPIATVDITAMGPTDIFTVPGNQIAESDGQYRVEFNNPGIYELTIRGVFHRTVSIPVMIFDQDQINLSIYLVPALYNSGRHFDKQEYLNWIRVYGNFNDYDFFTGESFRANDDGSISAFIKTDKDTIRYQVNGLSNGSLVLPGADDYAVRGQSFEAVLLNTTKPDSVELRFHPNDKRPYNYDIPEGLRPHRIRLHAFLQFDKPTDKFWTQPLQLMRSVFTNVQTITKAETENIRRLLIRESLSDSRSWWSSEEIIANRDTVTKALQQRDLHPQQRSALLISYVSLINQQLHRSEYLARIDQEPDPLNIDDSILLEIVDTVDPRNPVWAHNSDAPLTLLEQTGYTDEAVYYVEQMIKQHADDIVVRNLVLRLIERCADGYSEVQEMPYYRWIVERYGENNLARKAIVTFQQTTNKKAD